MIARIWQGETKREDGDAFEAILAGPGSRESREVAGNRGTLVLRRDEAERSGFIFLSLWDSMDAVRAFAGDEPERAHYTADAARYLLRLEPHVRHYEVAAGEGVSIEGV